MAPPGVPKPVRRGLGKQSRNGALDNSAGNAMGIPKDRNKYLNVSDILEKAFEMHNQVEPNPSDKYQPFPNDGLSSSDRNRQSKRIIEEHLSQLCEYDVIDKLTGEVTKANYYGRNTMGEVPASFMRNVVAIISADSELSVYRQAANNWAIKELISQKMTTKSRKHKEQLRLKRKSLNESGNGSGSWDPERMSNKPEQTTDNRNADDNELSNRRVPNSQHPSFNNTSPSRIERIDDTDRIERSRDYMRSPAKHYYTSPIAASRAKKAYRVASSLADERSMGSISDHSDIGHQYSAHRVIPNDEDVGTFNPTNHSSADPRSREDGNRQSNSDDRENVEGSSPLNSSQEEAEEIRALEARLDKLKKTKSKKRTTTPDKRDKTIAIPTARTRLRAPQSRTNERPSSVASKDNYKANKRQRRIGRFSG